MTIGQAQARLQSEAACERLRFALDRPPGMSVEPLDVESAFCLVEAALKDLRGAFGTPEEEPGSGAPLETREPGDVE